MADAFISYASENREQARMLAGALEANGWTVWWDRKIVTGQTFDQVIERELDAAGCVVVLWSKDSVGSEWVKNEAAVAAEQEVLVPAMIENVRLPLAFRRKQTANLTNWDGENTHPGFQALCAGVAAALRREAPSLPQPSRFPKRHRNRGKVVVLVAAACAVILAGLYVYFHFLPPDQPPSVELGGDCGDVLREIEEDHWKALEMLQRDKERAIELIDENFRKIDEAFRSCGADPSFMVLAGELGRVDYERSKGLLAEDRRRDFLSRARRSYEEAIRLDPGNIVAHDGLAKVLFFEGNPDSPINKRSQESPPQPPTPSGYREDVLGELEEAQREAVEMLGRDRENAIPLIDENFKKIDEAFESFGGEPRFMVLAGYAAKDVYQSSKGLLSRERRQHYLSLARRYFEEALGLNPDNAGAHNGLGNVLFFEENFDAAIEKHEEALRLTNGNYPAAEHDKELVERVKAGEIPFDF